MADNAQDPSLPQKKSARRRLVGAAVLCLGLAVALPFVFDAEPKRANKPQEVAVSVAMPRPAATEKIDPKPQVEAPVKEEVIDVPAAPAAPATPTPPVVAEAPVVPLAVVPISPIAPSAPKQAKSVSEVIAQAEKPKKSPATPDKTASKTEATASKPGAKYLIQIGAFGSASGAQEQVKRAAAAGQKAFTEDVATSAGKRIRVRVGPFLTREQAQKASDALKDAGIESALIAQ